MDNDLVNKKALEHWYYVEVEEAKQKVHRIIDIKAASVQRGLVTTAYHMKRTYGWYYL